MIIKHIVQYLRKWIGKNILKGHFPYAYAHYYYWYYTHKELDWEHPCDINQKLFWLARYWQSPLIVRCADKLSVRGYIKGLGLESILNEIYAEYASPDQIDIEHLPDYFVLKMNHLGGGDGVYICKDKNSFDIERVKVEIQSQLHKVIGLDTCEYQYQYIKPMIYAEKYIGDSQNNRLEIQFFCFNGVAKHILVRNDLGDAAEDSFAISYDMNWRRVHDRKIENMSIDIPRPKRLDEMIYIANKLAAPFPHVRIDLYYVDDQIIFGEMTFSTSGNILWNYTDKVVLEWGKELTLPQKLKCKWSDYYKSQAIG